VELAPMLGQGMPALLEAADKLERTLMAVTRRGVEGHLSAGMSLSELPLEGLPLNRKERFYTGTVLPALLAADNMDYLSRFTDLIGVGALRARSDPHACDVQMFTEYSFVESVVSKLDRVRFGEVWQTKETPDLVLWLPAHALSVSLG